MFLYLCLIFLGDDSKTLIKNLQDKFDKAKTVYLSFKQETTDGREFTASINGEFFFMRDNFYKYNTELQTIMTDTKTVWDYNLEKKQVTINDFNPDNQRVKPSQFLFTYTEDYNSIYEKKEKGSHVIKLVPKNIEKTNINLSDEYVRIWIDEKTGLPKKIQMFQKNGNSVTYNMNEIKLNNAYTISDFTFKLEKGKYEIIDLRF